MVKIVTFEPEEFEIAVVTYNRCEFVAEWLKHCYNEIRIRNIGLSIWDSSTNHDTQKYITAFNHENNTDIKYYHVNSETSVGYKPTFPLLNVRSKYVWIAGDSRYHDFAILDQKIFPYLKKDIDYIILHAVNNEENDGKIYTDKDSFLKECFVAITCIGLSIFKTSIFTPIRTNSLLRSQCDQKYKDNYGFGWIGYFLEMFALQNYKALFSVVPVLSINPDKKIQSWAKKFYRCWIEDLCNLLDGISEKYRGTNAVIKGTWKYLSLDRPSYCYEMRKSADLNPETLNKYKNNGMLQRVTKHTNRLERFANCTDEALEHCLKQEMLLEEKIFEELFLENLDKVKKKLEGNKLWIYGAGAGGRIAVKHFREHNIPICGMLDQNAEKIKFFEGLPVKMIHDINPDNSLIFISLFHWAAFVISSLTEHGIEKDKIFYIALDHM